MKTFNPDKPQNEKIVITWEDPVGNVGAIREYQIQILHKSVEFAGTFKEAKALCDGADPETIRLKRCEFDSIQLLEHIYNYTIDDSPSVRIVAINDYGQGEWSILNPADQQALVFNRKMFGLTSRRP